MSGAIVTGLTVIVVIVAKFAEGAWITMVAIPSLLGIMYAVHRHYESIKREIVLDVPLEGGLPTAPILVVTMQGWTRVGKQALQAAMAISQEIKVVYVAQEDKRSELCEKWNEYVANPASKANLPVPELVQIQSPYRLVVTPIIDYVRKLAEDNPDKRVIAVIPELVERRWFYWLLHTQRAELLKGRLMLEGNDRISVLTMPWHQKSA